MLCSMPYAIRAWDERPSLSSAMSVLLQDMADISAWQWPESLDSGMAHPHLPPPLLLQQMLEVSQDALLLQPDPLPSALLFNLAHFYSHSPLCQHVSSSGKPFLISTAFCKSAELTLSILGRVLAALFSVTVEITSVGRGMGQSAVLCIQHSVCQAHPRE